MTSHLHITNGDSAVCLMREAGIEGDILPWRDVLHDGPVPAGLDLGSLSRVRGDFIADRGWADRMEVHRGFRERDATLARWRDFDRITLWFEHDLYDQLQILQVLDFFAAEADACDRLSMICSDNYLGHCSPAELIGLRRFEAAVTPEQLELARAAWAAFRAPDPLAWHALLAADTAGLPFLAGAVERMLEEYPERETGLGATEHRVLTLLADGPMTAGRLFGANQAAEDRIYLGDLSYWALLNAMIHAPRPLLQCDGGRVTPGPEGGRTGVSLTPFGRALLDGVETGPSLHWTMRWFGGVCQLRDDHWCRRGLSEPERIRRKGEVMTGAVSIRVAEQGDVAAIRDCAQAAYARYIPRIGKPPGPMIDDYVATVARDDVHVAVTDQGELAGFVVLRPGPDSMLLDNVAVRPGAQGRGIGGDLLALAEARALAEGFQRIELYTHETMTENQALYRRRGYETVRRVRESGYDRIYLAKTLDP